MVLDDQQKHRINQTLLASTGSSEVLKKLQGLYKKKSGKYSLSFFCERAGLASKGYLSEVINGKKLLNLQYAESVAKAFFLKGTAASYFKVLVEIDHEKNSSRIVVLQKKKENLAKTLRVVRNEMPTSAQDPFFILNVYSSLGLFANAASFDDLIHHFGDQCKMELSQCLRFLELNKLIIKKDNTYQPVHDEVIFSSSADRISHFQFLKSCLEKTKHSVEGWYNEPAQAYFEASIISVNRQTYEKLLPKVREFTDEIQSKMESSTADQLVLFNLSIFPLAKTRI